MCPVCGFKGLDEEPYDKDKCASFETCSCCGTEFGYEDFNTPHTELRVKWIKDGCPFHYEEEKPLNWNPKKQLKDAKLLTDDLEEKLEKKSRQR